MRNTSWTKWECENFITMVTRYLDSCGYFMGDFNIHNLPKPDDWRPYGQEGICRWLLDMALQLNMECGFEYDVRLKGDRHDPAYRPYAQEEDTEAQQGSV